MAVDLSSLEALAELKFLHKQSAFSKVVAQETRLRSQISRIDDMARAADLTSQHDIKAVGADVAWKAWVGRKKTVLNRELAQVLAQKAAMLTTVRREHGRLLNARELSVAERASVEYRRAAKSLETVIELHHLKNM